MMNGILIETVDAVTVRRDRYEWFVEPIGSYTEECVATQLYAEQFGDENGKIQQMDRHGRPHNGWWVTFDFLLKLKESSKTDQALRFRSFHRRAGTRLTLTEFRFAKEAELAVRKARGKAVYRDSETKRVR